MQPQAPPTQASINTWAPRIRTYGNAFVAPVIQPTQSVLPMRATKRGTIQINYAEDGYDDDDFEDSEGGRRPLGLRTRQQREDPSQGRDVGMSKLGQEIYEPVQVQGWQRSWLQRHRQKYPPTDRHENLQSQLPLTLIPIRVDVDIPAHQIQDPIIWNLPPNHFRKTEQAPPYRLKDTFLWNLHEALITPQEFAENLVKDLDFPNEHMLILEISKQIRSQLEEYAGVALHPLFHVTQTKNPNGTTTQTIQNGQLGSSRDQSALATPAPLTNGANSPTPQSQSQSQPQSTDLTSLTNGATAFPTIPPFGSVTAIATFPDPEPTSLDSPDDTYRCIVKLSILLNKLYTDQFEWSLLHPPGTAEHFSAQTCADLGLNGEWAATMTHAIYEAVLKLKKEACESGGLVGYGEIQNMAVDAETNAGWRYDPDDMCDLWEPKVQYLSKEDLEIREKERERELRRHRREAARFSSTTNVASGMPTGSGTQLSSNQGFFDNPENSETPMGRGERSKKKRRFRSLSPLARAGTPGTRGTPDVGPSGWGGDESRLLSDQARQNWQCSHCLVRGVSVWGVRDGPPDRGPKSLCMNCGLLYERDKQLPIWSLYLHKDAKRW